MNKVPISIQVPNNNVCEVQSAFRSVAWVQRVELKTIQGGLCLELNKSYRGQTGFFVHVDQPNSTISLRKGENEDACICLKERRTVKSPE
jgi:hypothetical protein